MNDLHQQRVMVAMSGGVDSSVVAALLLRQGYQVSGATLQMGSEDESPTCSSSEAIHQAQEVARQLGIPHAVVNAHEAFEKLVLRPVWDEYARGRTPSPCLLCNRVIKFGLLLEFARSQGADYIATGHYARILHDPEGPRLLRGNHLPKDQSYFLSQLSLSQLKQILLPLGSLTKPEVREMARDWGLKTAERAESQDACISQEGLGLAETLRRRFGAEAPPGPILDPEGKQLGEHRGLHHYTIGQRRGLGIALGRPAHVSRLLPDQNTVVLSADPGALLRSELIATDIQWLAQPQSEVLAQIRSRHRAAPAELELLDCGKVRIRFQEPQSAITPGQAIAFYREDQVLGGGWIQRVL